MVLEAVPHLGYLHRCKEKIAENLAYYQYMPYTDRLDYLCAMTNNWAYALSVEKLAGQGLELGKQVGTTHPSSLPTGR